MLRVPTTTRAWCLLATYALLLLARLAHAAAPAPLDPAVTLAPNLPVAAADCGGPCSDPEHHHHHHHAHDDHCPVCQSVRLGANALPIPPSVALLVGDTRFVPQATHSGRAIARVIARQPARAPPAL